MIRHLLLAAVLGLSACAEPAPEMQVDGEIITHAVQHAQAQVDRGRRGTETASVAELGKWAR